MLRISITLLVAITFLTIDQNHALVLKQAVSSSMVADGMNVDRRLFTLKSITGFITSSYLIPKPSCAVDAVLPAEGEIEQSIPLSWDDEIPFDVKRDFTRLDTTPDSTFYSETRFVEHVDEQAVKIMTDYISSVLNLGDSVLDIGCSWTSHIVDFKRLSRVSAVGMNLNELKSNNALSDYTVLDLNQTPSPKLPYDDEIFDVALCQLSIDYFIHPLELMKEVSRVLKPGGKIVILFSNRLFLSKVCSQSFTAVVVPLVAGI